MSSSHSRRLFGWLSYAFASEVFVVVSLTLFLPICLEQFARDNGFLDPDHTKPCMSAPGGDTASTETRCSVKIGWLWIDSASFSLYVYSISVALQALTVISMGSIADRPTTRKPLLLSFALVGASAAILFLFLSSSSPLWILSAVFAICANVGFGASVVAMNAYLPSLARESPEVIKALDKSPTSPDVTPSIDLDADHALFSDPESVSAPLLGVEAMPNHQSPARKAYVAALSRATSRISSQGIASGYGAGILLLLLALVPVTQMHGSTFSLRLAIGLSGIWWMLFSIPAAIWLPGAPAHAYGGNDDKWTIGSEVVAAWKRLGVMLRWSEMMRLQHTFRYLAAWFLLSDGFTTITSTAILFGKTTLHMDNSSLVLIGAITPTAGILGSLFFPALQRRCGWSNLHVLVLLVVLVSCIPAYGCLGFVPFIRRMRVGGLTTPGEMFGLAVYFGFAYGAFQSYARACYAEMIPPREAARWYVRSRLALFPNSSSFVGPLIVGLIADSTGNIRYAFFFLVVMVWLAVPVLSSVDVEQGRIDAQSYTVERVQGTGSDARNVHTDGTR
ncbi:autophagy-related protein 22-like protein [Boletus reticuloceps]|uniref:Autophagy-related protein n=1 Tax=Boletus reticuloceps TaxID=495285 RepID=A0A8I2YI60_9AGAM|nr:autophagy-related protein 22-like protein [Boletus reticuloceps]